MKDLVKTASVLDKCLHILSICIKIGAVALVVGLVILAAGFLFDLPPQMVGKGYEHADLGFCTFTVAEQYLPDHHVIWWKVGAEMLLSLLCMVPAHFSVTTIRAILAPMKEGKPFHNAVSPNLRKLAGCACFLGIGMNLLEIISSILLIKAYDLNLLLVSERVPQVEFSFTFDLGFLVVSAVLMLLSYIFRYGEELQALSDETL